MLDPDPDPDARSYSLGVLIWAWGGLEVPAPGGGGLNENVGAEGRRDGAGFDSLGLEGTTLERSAWGVSSVGLPRTDSRVGQLGGVVEFEGEGSGDSPSPSHLLQTLSLLGRRREGRLQASRVCVDRQNQ